MKLEDNHFNRIQLSVMYKPFVDKIMLLAQNCEKRGHFYCATSGLRTWEEQNKLYTKGRTAPGGIVTNAKGGFSGHNFACSVDFCKDDNFPSTPGLKPNYADKAYIVLAQEAEKIGLESGLNWTSIIDAQHVQLPLKKHGLSWASLRAAYLKGGYPEVFKVLDQHGPW